MTVVTIGGVEVDDENIREVRNALYRIYRKRLAGEEVEELTIQSPLTRETVRYATVSIKFLKDELDELDVKIGGGRRARSIRYI